MEGRRIKRERDASGKLKREIDQEQINTVECYGSQAKKRQYQKPMTSERMLFAAVVGPDDKIYVFGGAAGLSTLTSTPVVDIREVYNPQTDSWAIITRYLIKGNLMPRF